MRPGHLTVLAALLTLAACGPPAPPPKASLDIVEETTNPDAAPPPGAPATPAAPAAPQAMTPATLKDGTPMALPADAQLAQKVEPPPPGLVSAEVYRVPSMKSVLSINLAKPAGGACQAILDKQKADTEKAMGDEKAKQVARLDALEIRDLGGSPALYNEVAARSAEEAAAGKPFHPGVGYVVCTKDAWVNLSLVVLEGELTPELREGMKKIALSVGKPPG